MNKLQHIFLFIPLLLFALQAKSQDTIVIRHPAVEVQTNVHFCLDIQASNVEEILGIQFALAWDESVLTYEGLNVNQPNSSTPYLPSLEKSNFGVHAGEIRFLWNNFDLTTISLAENSTLFQICFTATQANTNTKLETSEIIESIAIQAPDINSIPVVMESSDIIVTENDSDTNAVSLVMEDQSVKVGDEFCVPITIDQMTEMTSLQFSVEWDETQLAYTGLSFEEDVLGLNGLLPYYTIVENEFRLSWMERDATNLPLDGDTELFSLCFKVIGTANTQTEIKFNESVPLEIGKLINNVITEFPINTRNSIVFISRFNNSNSTQLNIANKSVESGENFCLPITASNFDELVGIQFALDWDEELLEFDRVQVGNSPLNLNITNYHFDGDQFRFLWTNNNAKNVLLPDETILFNICFDAIGDNEEATVLLGDNVPLEAYKIADNSIQNIPIETIAGIVEIGIEQHPAEGQFSIGSARVQIGERFCVPLTAEKIGNAIALQFSVKWDETVLTSAEVKLNEDLFPHSFVQQNLVENRLSFSWINFVDLTAIDLNETIHILELCFEAQGQLGTSTELAFGAIPIFEAVVIGSNGTDETVEVQLNNGIIQFGENTAAVYAGDTDLDGEVSHYDLINIGLGHGKTGPARENTTLAFIPQTAEDWATSTPITNINYKHADTDGNGIINTDDLLAIEQNWTFAPTLVNTIITEGGVPFYVDIDTVRLVEEQQIPVILGAENQLAKSIYGLAFSIYYESEEMLENGFGVSLHQSWLGEEEELIRVQRFFPEEKRMDIAISRIDQIGRDGFGELLALNIVVEDVILFDEGLIDLRIDHVRAIGDIEQSITFNNKGGEKPDKQNLTNTDHYLSSKINIYPNPATNYLYLKSEGVQVERIEVYDLFGKIVGLYLQTEQIDVHHLNAGLYFVNIQTNKGNVIKKVNIQ